MNWISDLASSVTEVAKRKWGSAKAELRGSRGVDVLDAEFREARDRLADGRAQEVVDTLTTTLDQLNSIEAATLSVLADAHDQLGDRGQSGKAHKRAVEVFQGVEIIPTPDQALAIVGALVATERRPEAAQLLRQVSEEYPERADVLRALGDHLKDIDDRVGAADAFGRLAQLLPVDDRIEPLRRATSLQPDNATYRIAYANALIEGDQNQLHEAVRVLEEPVGDVTDDQRLDIDSALADAQFRVGRFDDALAGANRVLARAPLHARSLLVRARVRRARSEDTAALADLNSLVESDPTNVDGHAERFDLVLESDFDAGTSEGTVYDDLLNDIDVVADQRPDDAVMMAEKLLDRGLVSLAASAFGRLVAQCEAHPRAWLGRGRLSLMDGRIEEAAEDFERAREAAVAADRPSDQAEALTRLAESANMVGDQQAALEHVEDALRLEPELAIAVLGRARLKANEGDARAAIADLRHLRSLLPEASWIDLELAEQHRIIGDGTKALELLDAAEQRGDDSAYLHGTRGQVLREQGDTKGAVAALTLAFERDEQTWIVIELAEALLEVGDRESYEQALEVIDVGLTSAGEVSALVRMKGEVLRLLDRPDEGLYWTDRFLEFEPSDATALATRAHLLVDVGRIEAALELVQTEFADEPPTWFARTAEARALLSLNRQPSALAIIDSLLDELGDQVWLQEMQASALVDIGEVEAALEIESALLAANPSDPRSNLILGACLVRLDPPDLIRALEHLRLAEQGDPDDIWGRLELAEALLATGDSTATEEFERVVAAASPRQGYANATSMAAWAALRLGRLEEAAAGFEAAAQSNPYWSDDRFYLGLSLLCAGRGELAIEEYEHALSQASHLAEHLRPDPPRVAAFLDEAIADVIDVMARVETLGGRERGRQDATISDVEQATADVLDMLHSARTAHRVRTEQPDGVLHVP